MQFGFLTEKSLNHHHYPTDKELQIKEFVIGTDNDMPIGFKSPVLPTEGLPILKHSLCPTQIGNLKAELKNFDNYFINQPSDRPVNPTMGELNYQEWVRFHNRHFTHPLPTIQFTLSLTDEIPITLTNN